MTPFDEATYTASSPANVPTSDFAVDTRPQSTLGIAALASGITCWFCVFLFVTGQPLPFIGLAIAATSISAMVLGAMGLSTHVVGRKVRRTAAGAGLAFGAVIAAVTIAYIGLIIWMFTIGGAQLG